jgi:hypothetical protein
VIDPRNTNSIAFSKSVDAATQSSDATDDLMPGDDWVLRCDNAALGNIEICSAYGAEGDAHQQLTISRAGRCDVSFLQQRCGVGVFARLPQNHRAHCARKLRDMLTPALHTHQLSADETLSSRFGDHPGPKLPRRIVTDVLSVTALELGDPVLFFVLMKTNDSPCGCAQ